jgi:signal transduction histidine kinase
MVDLVDLAREAVEDTGESTRVVFNTSFSDAPVIADRDKVKQVLINLLSNSVKFAPEETKITVSVASFDGRYRVGVRDEGPGISATDKERLFKRFSRLDATQTKPGSGLGLYLSRLIVERHGGHIWVESAPGEGTTFYFELPTAA